MTTSERRDRRRDPRPAPVGVLLMLGVTVAALVGRELFVLSVGSDEALQTWATMFVAVVLQALPFLGLGVAVGAVVAVLVSDRVLRAALPRRAAAAVPAAALAGVALPGCECGSVPVAGRLVARGVAPPAALAFMLSSPAVNPVVLVATAVAFPGQPRMVLARFGGSMLLAVVMGWLWPRLGRGVALRVPARSSVAAAAGSRGRALLDTAVHDLLQAGGFLVVGAAFAATLNVVVPPTWSATVAGVPVVSVLVLALLAVVLAVCSEADAFVAASLVGFSATAKLAFLLVGPAVDVKLVAMQAGTLGRRFAVRFAPATFVVAVLLAVLLGAVLLEGA